VTKDPRDRTDHRQSERQHSCISTSYRLESHTAGKMSGLATKQQSQKLFEKLKTKAANKVSTSISGPRMCAVEIWYKP
jgi:hypothetical protein